MIIFLTLLVRSPPTDILAEVSSTNNPVAHCVL